jgi:hypothetical protein
MRVAFGLVGLALAVIATGACDEPYKEADAVTCMAYLSLQSTAVSEGRAEGDAAALDAAGAAYRVLAEQKFTPDEVAQYFASTVAVFDDAATHEVAMIAGVCAAEARVVDA